MKAQPVYDLFDVDTVIIYLWRRKWTIIGAGVIAFAASLVVSLMMDPVYESAAVLYPTNSSSKYDLLEGESFGTEADAERLVQLLDSEPIRDSIVRKFNLIEHYDIDTSQRLWKHSLYEAYDGNIKFEKTVYLSVSVTVQDKDPELAAEIANEISRLVNVVRANVLRTTNRQALKGIEDQYLSKVAEITKKRDSLVTMNNRNAFEAMTILQTKTLEKQKRVAVIRDSLDSFRGKYKIFDYGYQVNVLNEQLAEVHANYLTEKGRYETLKNNLPETDTMVIGAKASMEGAQESVKFFEDRLKELTQINGTYTSLVDQLQLEINMLSQTQARYEAMLNSFDPTVTTLSLRNSEAELDLDRDILSTLRANYESALNNYLSPTPAAYLVSPAKATYKKKAPKTMLNVIVATALALVFAIVASAFYDKAKQISHRLNEA